MRLTRKYFLSKNKSHNPNRRVFDRLIEFDWTNLSKKYFSYNLLLFYYAIE